ncbi:MAG: sigma-70 family RNA polymerase sigma factor [Planctomycetes bacterium]|nr:sigma-70 family RNA polymerase sigma factor [Planctomycetota bacterium]
MNLTEHAPPDFFAWVAGLVHRHRTELLRYARRRGLEAEDALDAVQDAFVTFLDLPGAREIARTGTDAVKLLTVLVRNHVSNRRRKSVRRSEGIERLARERGERSAESSAELIARAEEYARVQGCILRMARLQRAVIELSLIDGEPHESIAKRLGVSVVHARVLLHRAREHVRHCSYEEVATPAPAEAKRQRAPRREVSARTKSRASKRETPRKP